MENRSPNSFSANLQNSSVSDPLKSRSGGATFWTVCRHCSFLHQYYRCYKGKFLQCYNCKTAFLALEVGTPGTQNFRCENGGELFSKEFPSALKNRGMLLKQTAAGDLPGSAAKIGSFEEKFAGFAKIDSSQEKFAGAGKFTGVAKHDFVRKNSSNSRAQDAEIIVLDLDTEPCLSKPESEVSGVAPDPVLSSDVAQAASCMKDLSKESPAAQIPYATTVTGSGNGNSEKESEFVNGNTINPNCSLKEQKVADLQAGTGTISSTGNANEMPASAPESSKKRKREKSVSGNMAFKNPLSAKKTKAMLADLGKILVQQYVKDTKASTADNPWPVLEDKAPPRTTVS